MAKKTYILKAELKDVEIRKVEDVVTDIKGTEYHKIVLSCDDVDGDRIYLTDKNMENLEKYKRGMVGTFHILIECEEDFGTKAKITVHGFEENK